jgi:hypothetical protein
VSGGFQGMRDDDRPLPPKYTHGRSCRSDRWNAVTSSRVHGEWDRLAAGCRDDRRPQVDFDRRPARSLVRQASEHDVLEHDRKHAVLKAVPEENVAVALGDHALDPEERQ